MKFHVVCCCFSAVVLAWAVAQAVAEIPRLIPPGTVARAGVGRYLGSVFGVGVLSPGRYHRRYHKYRPCYRPDSVLRLKIHFKPNLFQTKFFSFPLLNPY